MEVAIVKELKKLYNTFPALDGINFSIRKGEVLVLLARMISENHDRRPFINVAEKDLFCRINIMKIFLRRITQGYTLNKCSHYVIPSEAKSLF